MTYEEQIQEKIQQHTNVNQQIIEHETIAGNLKERRSRLVGQIELLQELLAETNGDKPVETVKG